MSIVRQQDTRQFASAEQIDQLEGLAVARSWGFESPFRTNLRSRASQLRLASQRANSPTCEGCPP